MSYKNPLADEPEISPYSGFHHQLFSGVGQAHGAPGADL